MYKKNRKLKILYKCISNDKHKVIITDFLDYEAIVTDFLYIKPQSPTLVMTHNPPRDRLSRHENVIWLTEALLDYFINKTVTASVQ